MLMLINVNVDRHRLDTQCIKALHLLANDLSGHQNPMRIESNHTYDHTNQPKTQVANQTNASNSLTAVT